MEAVQNQKQSAIAQHSKQAEEFAGRYRDFETNPYQNCFTYSRHCLDKWLERFLPSSGSGLKILDVGCGTGHHLARLRHRGFEVSGVDGSAEMLEEARTLNPGVDIRHSDVEAIPFPDRSFEFVLCIEVLRYLPDPMPCIQEMARVLKPGGMALVTAAPLLNLNGYWLVNRLANLLPLGNLVRLKQFFTTSGRLRRSFQAAGFRNVEVHGVYFGPINWVERICPWALPSFLKRWERLDAALADRWLLRQLSNMFLVRAER